MAIFETFFTKFISYVNVFWDIRLNWNTLTLQTNATEWDEEDFQSATLNNYMDCWGVIYQHNNISFFLIVSELATFNKLIGKLSIILCI